MALEFHNENLNCSGYEASPPLFPEYGRYAVLVVPQTVGRGRYDTNLFPYLPAMGDEYNIPQEMLCSGL